MDRARCQLMWTFSKPSLFITILGADQNPPCDGADERFVVAEARHLGPADRRDAAVALDPGDERDSVAAERGREIFDLVSADDEDGAHSAPARHTSRI